MEARKDGVSTSKKPKSLALEKMEILVRQMQSSDAGVPVRCQKLFLTTIPSAFMGYDLIEWLMENLPIDDSAEALHLASLLCQHGYFFPVGDAKTLVVKDDSSLYRFQTPYYWPSQNHVPDSTDYAIYLHKKISKNKQKHGLEDCELEAYNQLKKTLASKWDFVTMQADEQLKMAKDRKKGDKIVSESQERAYWRVYRPPPGFTNTLETPPVPDKARPQIPACSSGTLLKKERDFLQLCLTRLRIKISQVAESMVNHHETYLELDPFLSPVQPSNPWLTDDATFMELNEPIVEFPTERRVRRWAISMEETVSDPTGLHEFTTCMQKEFSHENIRFWSAVHQLKKAPLSQVETEVNNIYDEFLRPGAPCEINIDSKTMERTQELLKAPSRFTYDLAAEHIYDLLLKKDCYPRFLRSEHYKNLLLNATNPTSKKRFFTFGATGKKKISTVTPPNMSQLAITAGRSASDDTPTATANPGAAKPECDPPYRKDEDAGIFLGGPPSPPLAGRPPLSPSPSVSSGGQQRPPAAAKQSEVMAPAAGGASIASAVMTPSVSSAAAAASIIGSAAIASSPPSSPPVLGLAASPPALESAHGSTEEPPAVPTPAGTPSRKIATVQPPTSGQLAAVCDETTAKKRDCSEPESAVPEELPPPPDEGGKLVSFLSDTDQDVDQVQTFPSPPDCEFTEVAPPPHQFAPAPLESDVFQASDKGIGFADQSTDQEATPSQQPSAEDIEFELSASAANYEQPCVSSYIEPEQPCRELHAVDRVNLERAATAIVAATAAKPVILTAPLQLMPPSAGDLPLWEPAAIAPPVAFQDLGGVASAPLATIDESMEEPSSVSSPVPEPKAASDKVMTDSPVTSSPLMTSPKMSRTEIVTLTDSCAQTVETGDSGDYGGTTDKQCEANLPRDGSTCQSGRGTRRKEKRVKICEHLPQSSSAEEPPAEADSTATAGTSAPAGVAVSAAASEAQQPPSAPQEVETAARQKRRSRSGSADGKKERKECRGKRDAKKKSTGERRRTKHDEAGGGESGASPKRGDVVAPAAADPAPQTLDESSVCPWENEEACKLDAPFVKTYATLGYL